MSFWRFLTLHSSKLCFIALISLIFYTLSLNCSETIILTPKDFSKIKIRFDFPQQDAQEAAPSPVKVASPTTQRFDQELVTFVVTDKLNQLRQFLLNQTTETNSSFSSTTAPSADSLKSDLSIEPFLLNINKPDYKLNVSLDTIQIAGLSSFTLSDIATNVKSRKVSALLRFTNLRIFIYYKVSGFRTSSEEGQNTRTYNDKGKILYTVHGWRTAFSGKVVDIVNKTRLGLAGFGMRSHYDFFETTVESFVHGQDRNSLIDICKHISSDVLKKSINAVDDKLESIMLDELGVREMATWANFKDQSEQYDREEDGHLLMMESKVHERNSRRRRKRQVPCEVGEELDEYVDSLFRFLKRLVRVMEPFSLPNATIELEEYNLQIFLHSGGATRAYTFERKKPAWVLCRNETTTLGLTVGVEELRVHYKYRVIQDWRLLFDGDLEAQIRRPKAQLQITQLNPPEEDEDSESDEDAPQVQQRIDRLKVWQPGSINLIIRGLGNLSSALSMIINQMLSDTSTIEPIIEMIETDGVVAANDLLRNVSIPIFSII